ncbi:MAG TPA: DUF4118 domain-containing protein, partial [Trichocoleus sp.]
MSLALLLTLTLEPFLQPTIFAFFYAAVAISAWAGGLGSGLLAAGLSLVGINYFLIAPMHSFAIAGFGSLVQM